ncbi:virulence factor SrfC family protein [Tropicimonas sp. IMCC34043]|uniref:virulence factor SrfC family protein n=1 Tax=Tropicimonas sp. IMCC34043 TaxID=2248760 RepID=UPI000E23BE77|nr:virulence factor SrfC family protein [Tropicimonas sp. IMCC34043]
MSGPEELGARCREVAELAGKALEWIDDPEAQAMVGPDRKALTKLLRRGSRRATKLARSAETKLSVSVFGPSQAGKSFLVSVLARPEGGRLVADFNGPGGKLDYISAINPVGDGESTGLVTRFTMTKDQTPEGFPIKLVLLSEADIARTIMNSFYMDGDQSEVPPEPEDLTAHIEAFRGRMSDGEKGLSYDDVHEIAEYVEASFGKTAYAAALKPFWDEASVILPKLALPDRAEFLALLWGRHAAFTDLFLRLARATAQIDNAPVVYATLAALTPRETSIIDVGTLHGLLDDVQTDMLEIQTEAGKRAKLPRAIVCALAAELVFPMETQPSDVFAETDLLDFPGARNRFDQPLSKTLADPVAAISGLLLRGKVAYLFDRYVENQEITSMLLCVPDSNMETLDLPGLVENWIVQTHGGTPQERATNDCILFFVLTKFDKHLGDSAAGGEESQRFERRMKFSLQEKFGRGRDPWVERWTPSTPFQNCFWLRNPNFFVDGLIEYDGDRELRIRPEKEARVDELRTGCISAAPVQKHFSDPAAAWDAALTMNDGGVSYLTGALTRVCTPASKVRQLTTQIEKTASDIEAALSPYYVSDDVEKRVDEKRLAAADIIDGLEIALQNHRFGAFLRSLTVDQELIQDRIARVPSSIRISSAVSSAAAEEPARVATAGAVARPARPGRPARPADPSAAKPADPAPVAARDANAIRTMTAAMFQSNTAVEVWLDRLAEFRDDTDLLRAFHLTTASASDLLSELTHGLRRCRVPQRIVEQLEAINFGHTVDKQAPPAAIVCAEQINEFVNGLGFTHLPQDQRPTAPGSDGVERPIFLTRPSRESAEDLPTLQRATARDKWTDWVFGLEAMFVANAMDSEGGTVNIELNGRLGRILTRLAGAEV